MKKKLVSLMLAISLAAMSGVSAQAEAMNEEVNEFGVTESQIKDLYSLIEESVTKNYLDVYGIEYETFELPAEDDVAWNYLQNLVDNYTISMVAVDEVYLPEYINCQVEENVSALMQSVFTGMYDWHQKYFATPSDFNNRADFQLKLNSVFPFNEYFIENVTFSGENITESTLEETAAESTEEIGAPTQEELDSILLPSTNMIAETVAGLNIAAEAEEFIKTSIWYYMNDDEDGAFDAYLEFSEKYPDPQVLQCIMPWEEIWRTYAEGLKLIPNDIRTSIIELGNSTNAAMGDAQPYLANTFLEYASLVLTGEAGNGEEISDFESFATCFGTYYGGLYLEYYTTVVKGGGTADMVPEGEKYAELHKGIEALYAMVSELPKAE